MGSVQRLSTQVRQHRTYHSRETTPSARRLFPRCCSWMDTGTWILGVVNPSEVNPLSERLFCCAAATCGWL